jgi:hypothetical protein
VQAASLECRPLYSVKSGNEKYSLWKNIHTLVLLNGAGLQEEAWQRLRHDDALVIALFHGHSETLDRKTHTSTADCHQEVSICNNTLHSYLNKVILFITPPTAGLKLYDSPTQTNVDFLYKTNIHLQ